MRPWSKGQRFELPTQRNGLPTKVRVVADAAVASSGVGEGRLVPVLIFDGHERPDLAEFIRVHEHVPPGDVETRWGQLRESQSAVVLILSFKAPMELDALLEFDVVKQGGLVDLILSAKVLCLQAGREGDRFVTTFNAPKIYVEVADTGFRKVWDKLFLQRITKHMRKQGLSAKQAKLAAQKFIEEMRQLGERFRQ